MSKWLLSLSILALAGSVGVTSMGTLSRTPEGGSARMRGQTRALIRLSRELAEIQVKLADSQATLSCYEQDRVQQQAFQHRFLELEALQNGTQAAVDEQALAILNAGKRQDLLLREAIGKQFDDLSTTLEATVQIAERNRESFDDLLLSVDDSQTQGAPARDVHSLWADLMGPTVQISDDATVGSGVLLKSRELEGGEYRTYLLTAWHVVRDILGDADDLEQQIRVHVYHLSKARTKEFATLVCRDERLDTALLLMSSKKAFEYGAVLPSRAALESKRVFSTIYAVGCPLGNDPIPTYGEVADTNHLVDGDRYWMINAPTYIGNSGGGIYDSDSHELLGIFSKIYTHGSLRPTVVPHMGLATPLGAVYDWLETSGQGHVVPK